jgi:NhaP-type Na+/H+ or K+/H+ antiporter
MNVDFLILAAALVLVYGAVSGIASRSIVTPPMAFMLTGVLCGPLVFNLFEVPYRAAAVELLATVALVIIVSADASQISFRQFRKSERLPGRLLLIGLPLTMVLGAGIAKLIFPGFELAAVALIAVILSPTDAALGQAIITNESVPETTREGINVESGLNDGICLPPIFILLFLLGADLSDVPHHDWVSFTLMQLLMAPVAGAIVGFGGGRLIDLAARRNWVDEGFGRLTMPAIALLAYALAEAIGGNGFIAAFVSGLMLGVRTKSVREKMQNFSETEGTLLSLLVFLILGLSLIPMTLKYWNLMTTVYAILSLTVIRMLPVAISVIGLGYNWRTKLVIGWFGPRGIASILYLLLLVRYLGSSGYEILIATGVQTVALSVLLHGLTASPLASLYGRWMQAHGSRGRTAA